MRRLGLQLEVLRQVAELEDVLVRIGIACEREGVQVAALLEGGAVREGGLDEAEVEADVVADEQRVIRPLEQLLHRVLGGRRLGNVLVRDAVELRADDR